MHLCKSLVQERLLIEKALIRCKDLQTSADAFEAGKSTGAMSFALISTYVLFLSFYGLLPHDPHPSVLPILIMLHVLLV